MKLISQNLKYILLLLLFVLISYLSLLAVYKIASDQSSFLSLGIFSNWLFVQLAILLIIYFTADVLRFYYTLKAIDVTVPLKYMVALAFVNIFVSNITPSATGGGVAQIYLLNKKGVSIGAATAGSSIRTALPIMFFTICTPIILIFDSKIKQILPGGHFWIYVAVMVLFDLLLIWLILSLTRKPEKVVNLILGIRKFFERRALKDDSKVFVFLDRLADETGRFSTHFMMYLRGDRRYVLLSVLFSLTFLLALFLFPYFLIRDLNPTVSVVDVVLFQIVITAVMYFAPTPGAAGIAEAAFVAMFSNYVDQAYIVSLTFAWRLFTIYIGVIIGLVVFYVQIMKKHEKFELYR